MLVEWSFSVCSDLLFTSFVHPIHNSSFTIPWIPNLLVCCSEFWPSWIKLGCLTFCSYGGWSMWRFNHYPVPVRIRYIVVFNVYLIFHFASKKWQILVFFQLLHSEFDLSVSSTSGGLTITKGINSVYGQNSWPNYWYCIIFQVLHQGFGTKCGNRLVRQCSFVFRTRHHWIWNRSVGANPAVREPSSFPAVCRRGIFAYFI